MAEAAPRIVQFEAIRDELSPLRLRPSAEDYALKDDQKLADEFLSVANDVLGLVEHARRFERRAERKVGQYTVAIQDDAKHDDPGMLSTRAKGQWNSHMIRVEIAAPYITEQSKELDIDLGQSVAFTCSDRYPYRHPDDRRTNFGLVWKFDKLEEKNPKPPLIELLGLEQPSETFKVVETQGATQDEAQVKRGIGLAIQIARQVKRRPSALRAAPFQYRYYKDNPKGRYRLMD
jgi:hypothetical protein